MSESDVVLVSMPQADGGLKNRPAVILREMPRYRDFLVCGISRQLHHAVDDFDELISPGDADFASSGLRTASLIRLGFLNVVPRQQVPGRIGYISTQRHQRLLQKLSDYLSRSGLPEGL